MKTVILFSLALAGGLGLGEASAADMRMPYPRAPQGTVEEFGSGWYLRGDVGWVGIADVSADSFANGGAISPYRDAKLADTWVVGAGFGYKAGWFRADVTADYRAHSEFSGVLASTLSGEVTTWSTLLNGYFDLGSWSGITPYVGAGIGGAYHDTGRWRNSAGTAMYADGTGWDLAWAVMAGAAMRVGPNLSLDIGYRYVDLGRPESGLDVATQTGRVRFDNVTAHEVRAGLRYMID